MAGESNSKLRAAVYQRILTDNIVGIDLQENDTTRWHDEQVRNQAKEGSSVVSHAGSIVSATPTLGGNSLDEKIIALANVFRLLYHKRRYEVEDTPLWWSWKHGKVTMQIALERMHRWVNSTRPMDVIVLMRYAMTSFYVLADEGVPIQRTDLVFDMKNILAYRIEREADAEQLGEEPYRQDTDLSVVLKDIKNGNYEGEGRKIIPEGDDEDDEDDSIKLEVSWKKRNRDEEDTGAKEKELEELKESKKKLEDKNNLTKVEKNRLGQVNLQIASMTTSTGELKDSRVSRYGTELYVDEEISYYKPMTTAEKILELAPTKLIAENTLKQGSLVQLFELFLVRDDTSDSVIDNNDNVYRKEGNTYKNVNDEKIYEPIQLYGAPKMLVEIDTNGMPKDQNEKGKITKDDIAASSISVFTAQQSEPITLFNAGDNVYTGKVNEGDVYYLILNKKHYETKVERARTLNTMADLTDLTDEEKESLLNGDAGMILLIKYLKTTKAWADIENNPFKDFTELTIRRKEEIAEAADRKEGLLKWSCNKGYRKTEQVANAFLEWLRHGRRLRGDDSVSQHYGDTFLKFFSELRRENNRDDTGDDTGGRAGVGLGPAASIRRTTEELQLIPAGESVEDNLTQQVQTIVRKAIDDLQFGDLGVSLSSKTSVPDKAEEDSLLEIVKVKLKEQVDDCTQTWKEQLGEEPLSLKTLTRDTFKGKLGVTLKDKVKTVIGARAAQEEVKDRVKNDIQIFLQRVLPGLTDLSNDELLFLTQVKSLWDTIKEMFEVYANVTGEKQFREEFRTNKDTYESMIEDTLKRKRRSNNQKVETASSGNSEEESTSSSGDSEQSDSEKGVVEAPTTEAEKEEKSTSSSGDSEQSDSEKGVVEAPTTEAEKEEKSDLSFRIGDSVEYGENDIPINMSLDNLRKAAEQQKQKVAEEAKAAEEANAAEEAAKIKAAEEEAKRKAAEAAAKIKAAEEAAKVKAAEAATQAIYPEDAKPTALLNSIRHTEEEFKQMREYLRKKNFPYDWTNDKVLEERQTEANKQYEELKRQYYVRRQCWDDIEEKQRQILGKWLDDWSGEEALAISREHNQVQAGVWYVAYKTEEDTPVGAVMIEVAAKSMEDHLKDLQDEIEALRKERGEEALSDERKEDQEWKRKREKFVREQIEKKQRFLGKQAWMFNLIQSKTDGKGKKGIGTFLVNQLFEKNTGEPFLRRGGTLFLESSNVGIEFYIKIILRYELNMFIVNLQEISQRGVYAKERKAEINKLLDYVNSQTVDSEDDSEDASDSEDDKANKLEEAEIEELKKAIKQLKKGETAEVKKYEYSAPVQLRPYKVEEDKERSDWEELENRELELGDILLMEYEETEDKKKIIKQYYAFISSFGTGKRAIVIQFQDGQVMNYPDKEELKKDLAKIQKIKKSLSEPESEGEDESDEEAEEEEEYLQSSVFGYEQAEEFAKEYNDKDESEKEKLLKWLISFVPVSNAANDGSEDIDSTKEGNSASDDGEDDNDDLDDSAPDDEDDDDEDYSASDDDDSASDDDDSAFDDDDSASDDKAKRFADINKAWLYGKLKCNSDTNKMLTDDNFTVAYETAIRKLLTFYAGENLTEAETNKLLQESYQRSWQSSPPTTVVGSNGEQALNLVENQIATNVIALQAKGNGGNNEEEKQPDSLWSNRFTLQQQIKNVKTTKLGNKGQFQSLSQTDIPKIDLAIKILDMELNWRQNVINYVKFIRTTGDVRKFDDKVQTVEQLMKKKPSGLGLRLVGATILAGINGIDGEYITDLKNAINDYHALDPQKEAQKIVEAIEKVKEAENNLIKSIVALDEWKYAPIDTLEKEQETLTGKKKRTENEKKRLQNINKQLKKAQNIVKAKNISAIRKQLETKITNATGDMKTYWEDLSDQLVDILEAQKTVASETMKRIIQIEKDGNIPRSKNGSIMYNDDFYYAEAIKVLESIQTAEEVSEWKTKWGDRNRLLYVPSENLTINLEGQEVLSDSAGSEGSSDSEGEESSEESSEQSSEESNSDGT